MLETKFPLLGHGLHGNGNSAIAADLGSVRHCVSLQKPQMTFNEQDYEKLPRPRAKQTEPDALVAEDDVDRPHIFPTAGTTGKPKGAMRTRRHLMSDAVTSVIDLRVEYDENMLIVFPMYHIACEDNIVRHSFMPNTFSIRREGNFDPPQILNYISDERI